MSFIQWLIDIFTTEKDAKHYQAGMKLMESEQFSKATYEFAEALKINPTEEKYHGAFGKSLYKRGMTNEAETAFGIADDLNEIKKEPGNVKMLCRLALAFQDKRMFPLSQRYIQRAIAIKPDNDQVQFLLGRANYLADRFTEAIEQYNKTIKLNSYYLDAYKGLRDVYSAQGKRAKQKQFEELAKHIQKVAESADDADLHADLGDIFHKYNNKNYAENEYNEALRLNGKCEKALLGMGILKYKKGHYPIAKKQFLQVIKIQKYNSIAHSYLGLIYKADSKTKKEAEWEFALVKQLKELEKVKDKFKAYINLGDFLFEGKKMGDAEEAYILALRISSKSPELLVKLAILYGRINKAREAVDYCEQAIKLAPEEAPGYIGKGRVFLGMGELDRAIAMFQEALTYAPKNPDIHKYLAEAYKKKGLYELADKEMRIMGSLESTEQEVI